MILKSRICVGILSALTFINLFPGTAEAGPGYGALYKAPNGEIWGTTGREYNNYNDRPEDGGIFKIMPDGAWTWVASAGNHRGMNASLVHVASLVPVGNFLWGTSSAGGEYGETYDPPLDDLRVPGGTVFKVNMTTGEVTTVVEFVSQFVPQSPGDDNYGREGGPFDGLELVHDAALNQDFLWGTTERGGANNLGTVFKVNVATGVMTTVVNFSGAVPANFDPANPNVLDPVGANLGAYPRAGLTSDGAGYLWGTANAAPFDDDNFSGPAGVATVFKIEVATGVMTTIRSTSSPEARYHSRMINDGNGYMRWMGEGGEYYYCHIASGYVESLFGLGDAVPSLENSRSGLASDGNGFVWGTGIRFGSSGHEGVFKTVENLEDFSGSNAVTTQLVFSGNGPINKGSTPIGTLMNDGGDFMWGTTNGDIQGPATVFKVNKYTGVLTTIVNFNLPPGNTPPVVTLLGANPLTFEAAATFTDAGATANDAQDGPRTPFINTTALHPTTVVPNVPGTYYVTWDATDTAGATGTNTRKVIVVDTTPPTITGTFTGLTTLSPTMPNYMTTLATAADIVGVTQFSQSPAPGTATTAGSTTVTLHAEDAAGNQTSVSFNVTVGTTPPTRTLLGCKGDAILGAGVAGSGIPAGAVWNTFGVPSVNDAGQAVVLARFKVTPFSPPYSGIFAFDVANPATMKLIAKNGDAALGAPGAPPLFSTTMSTLKDPLLGQDGSIAWTTTLAGGTVSSTNNAAIYLDSDGVGPLPAYMVARKGSVATGSAVWNQFLSVSLGENAVAFTATLQPTIGGVTPTTNTGLWMFDRNSLTTATALRTGDLWPGSISTVKIIAALVDHPGSSGQGRGVESDGSLDATKVRVTLTDNRQVICDVAEDGSVLPLYTALDNAVDYGVGAKWQSFGLPTQNSLSASTAFLGTVKPLTGTATAANNVAIFAEDDFAYAPLLVVKKGDPSGVPSGVFSAFLDPVSASNRSVAFKGTLKTAGGINAANNDGIWMSDDTNGLSLVAREGAQAAEAPIDAKWKAFTQLALPEGRGPLFVASMLGGPITTANHMGLWATDSTGLVRLLLQKGDVIGGKTVSSFTVLSSVVGSQAQTRSFNNSGSVIVLFTDTLNAQCLLHIEVP